MKPLIKAISLTVCLCFSSSVLASLITLVEENIHEAYQIDQSFEAFYNYGGKYQKAGADKYSSNTGMEVSNYLTLFFVENLNQEVALFGLIDKAKDKSGGNMLLNIHVDQGDASLLSFLLIDDSGDIKRKNTDLDASDNAWDIEWKWAKNYSDGFILTGFEHDDFQLSFSSSNFKGINGFNVLTFPQPKVLAAADSLSVTSVNEPLSLLLFSFGLLAIGNVKRKTI